MTLYLAGLPLTLYAFVGMIMLIGIVKKNAIMMIDFALARERGENVPPETAIFEAAIIRFRPIMMTTMAALMGTLPIAIGFGAGGETRRPLGLAVVGGLVPTGRPPLVLRMSIPSLRPLSSARSVRAASRRR